MFSVACHSPRLAQQGNLLVKLWLGPLQSCVESFPSVSGRIFCNEAPPSLVQHRPRFVAVAEETMVARDSCSVVLARGSWRFLQWPADEVTYAWAPPFHNGGGDDAIEPFNHNQPLIPYYQVTKACRSDKLLLYQAKCLKGHIPGHRLKKGNIPGHRLKRAYLLYI